ncbi:preprotein translocase subunit SecE [Candidatus Gottesmanbacteria bacterium]|nr:preprotein translocase subunit SecE [Candidatus Gottesmanbacteria bacterium]
MTKTLSPVLFLRQARSELSKVVWPTRTEAIRLTLVVLGVSIAIGIYIGTLDIFFVKLTELIITR